MTVCNNNYHEFRGTIKGETATIEGLNVSYRQFVGGHHLFLWGGLERVRVCDPLTEKMSSIYIASQDYLKLLLNRIDQQAPKQNEIQSRKMELIEIVRNAPKEAYDSLSSSEKITDLLCRLIQTSDKELSALEEEWAEIAIALAKSHPDAFASKPILSWGLSEAGRVKALCNFASGCRDKDKDKECESLIQLFMDAKIESKEGIVAVCSEMIHLKDWFSKNIRRLNITDKEVLLPLIVRVFNSGLHQGGHFIHYYGLNEEERTKILIHTGDISMLFAFDIQREDLVVQALKKWVSISPFEVLLAIQRIPPSKEIQEIEKEARRLYFQEFKERALERDWGFLGEIPSLDKVMDRIVDLSIYQKTPFADLGEDFLQSRLPHLGPLYEKLLDPASKKTLEQREWATEQLKRIEFSLMLLEQLKAEESESMKKIELKDLQTTLAHLLEQIFIHPRSEEQLFNFSWDIGMSLANPALLSSWLETLPKSRAIHCLVPSVYLFFIDKESKELKNLNELVAKQRKIFRDGPKEKVLSSFLFHLVGKVNEGGDKTFHLKLARAVLEDGNPLERCHIISSILSIDPSYLKDPNLPIEEMRALLRKAFLGAFHLPSDVSMEEIDRFMQSWRDPNAIVTYLGKIRQLPEKEQKPLLEKYQQWFFEAFKSNFSTWRYKQSEHLQQIRNQGFGNVVDAWAQQREKSLTRIENSNLSNPLEARIQESLTRFLVHFNHVDPDKIPYLMSVLKQEKSLEAAIQEMKDMEDQIPIDSSFCMQRLALKAMGKGSSKEDLANLQRAVEDLVKEDRATYSQFNADLKEFARQEALLAHQPVSRDLLLFDTDDMQDLLLLGSESGGCQSVYGTPEFNKSALAYVVDGKNRAIVLKDPETKKIVARAIVRLLWDPKANKPVLFTERHYLTYPNPNLSRQLDKYATHLGKELSLEVYHKGSENHPNAQTLQVLALSAPFEYSDAGGGMQTEPYQIENATLICL